MLDDTNSSSTPYVPPCKAAARQLRELAAALNNQVALRRVAHLLTNSQEQDTLFRVIDRLEDTARNILHNTPSL